MIRKKLQKLTLFCPNGFFSSLEFIGGVHRELKLSCYALAMQSCTSLVPDYSLCLYNSFNTFVQDCNVLSNCIGNMFVSFLYLKYLILLVFSVLVSSTS